MDVYLTMYTVPSLGRWLVALTASLVLLALAYAQAPDPAGQLGLQPPAAHSLASHPAAPSLAGSQHR